MPSSHCFSQLEDLHAVELEQTMSTPYFSPSMSGFHSDDMTLYHSISERAKLFPPVSRVMHYSVVKENAK